MRKLILIGLSAFVIIGTAALAINWFDRASVAKDTIKLRLESLNTADSKVTYEAITTSGFPFSMNVSIVKPHFVGRIDKILEGKNLEKILKIETLPQWGEDYLLNGSIDLSVNVFSNRFKLTQRGNFETKGNISGKTITLNTEFSGNNTCYLHLKKTGGMFGKLWDFYALYNNKDSNIRDFRSFNCVLSSGKTVNSETNETLMTYADSSISAIYEPHKDLSDARFYLKLSDFEVNKAYDEIASVYHQSLFPNKIIPAPSSYGKQNIEIDISYNGTENWKSPEAKNSPLDFKINKFVISNAAYNTDMSAKVQNIINGDERNTIVYYKSESTVTELFNSLLKNELLTTRESLISNELMPQEMKDNISKLSTEEINGLISSIIPDFASFGKTLVELDMNFSGTKELNSGNTTIKSLEFSTVPYGITANAAADRNKDTMAVSGNASLSCRNCLNMVGDIMGYFKRVASVVSALSPKTVANIKISPELVQATKDFLVAIAPSNEGTLKFDLINDGAGKITINGKNTFELMELFNKIVAPVLQNEQQ
jgi:hypothetical protein